MSLSSSVIAGVVFSLAAFSAEATEIVPSGNRHATQPPVPSASARRTQAGQSTYDRKYKKIYALLESNAALRAKIIEAAGEYDVAPIHMIGAIIGEHTYNVDAYDHLQTYYVKAVSYLKSSFSFSYEGETVEAFIRQPAFADCGDEMDSYALWSCREAVWDEKYRDQVVEGTHYPNDRFSAVFFQPFYAGQTFGIGQLNPLTALQMSDMVHGTSGLPKLDHRDPQQVYRTIMDPDMSLTYMAAILRKSIDVYADVAGFDISKNPGLTATLYNLGNVETRAAKLAAENRLLRKQGRTPRWPRENYYGWLINDRLMELEALIADS
ncbi:DUF1402 family protein [Chelativorans sp. YIM 93263]|uniref:DUF1402 family protein n=1 Tax=Chelativorans sp. YIM 93263 TaxID=2906648 RepID=UPI00403E0365